MNELIASWDLARVVAEHCRAVLLYGAPGTGKTWAATSYGVTDPSRVHPILLTEDTPAAELRGHWITTERGMQWADGPALRAWRDGGRLIVNEIDKASPDALSFLYTVLDTRESAVLELATTGEIVKPHPNFSCWATMNGTPDDLTPALRDRFPVQIEIPDPNPEAIARLPHDLRPLAEAPADRRVGLRVLYEFAHLRSRIGEEIAAQACFGPRCYDIVDTLQAARMADAR